MGLEKGARVLPNQAVCFTPRCLCTGCSPPCHAHHRHQENPTGASKRASPVSTSHTICPPAQTRPSAAPSPGPIWKLISLPYVTTHQDMEKDMGCGIRPAGPKPNSATIGQGHLSVAGASLTSVPHLQEWETRGTDYSP